jgi:NAD(P)-dependent dehydrogenase (short-subunit alcohol dehydrogenase family)
MRRRMPDWLGLEGQRAVVAGGAGTIGSALVAGFLDARARVGVIDLDTSALDPRVGASAEADLTDPGRARASLDAVREQLGGLDVLVHCVGINDRKPIESYTGSEWDRIVAVNLTSAFHLGAQAAAAMREQGHGRIVFFSSVAGRSGHKLHGPYAATKGAINQLMRVIAHEYAPHGVTANAVAPGYMDTELTRQYLAEHPDKRQALIELIPAGRFGTLREVVDPVLFLCSPHASFITGQVLYIDGGRTIV